MGEDIKFHGYSVIHDYNNIKSYIYLYIKNENDSDSNIDIEEINRFCEILGSKKLEMFVILW